MYAIKQHQDDPEAITANLRSIIPHMYGQHDTRDTRWCHHSADRGKHCYRSLPYGKLHSDTSTKVALEK